MKKLIITICLLLVSTTIFAAYSSGRGSGGFSSGRSFSGSSFSRSYSRPSYNYRPSQSYSTPSNRTTIINNHSNGYGGSSSGGFWSGMMGAMVGSSIANSNNNPVVMAQAPIQQPVQQQLIAPPDYPQPLMQESPDYYILVGLLKFLFLCLCLYSIYRLMKKFILKE